MLLILYFDSFVLPFKPLQVFGLPLFSSDWPARVDESWWNVIRLKWVVCLLAFFSSLSHHAVPYATYQSRARNETEHQSQNSARHPLALCRVKPDFGDVLKTSAIDFQWAPHSLNKMTTAQTVSTSRWKQLVSKQDKLTRSISKD